MVRRVFLLTPSRPQVIYWPPVVLAGVLALGFVVGLTFLCSSGSRKMIPTQEGPVPAFAEVIPSAPIVPTIVEAKPADAPESPSLPEPTRFLPTMMNPVAMEGSLPPPTSDKTLPPPAPPTPPPFKHRTLFSADDLARQLLTVPELDMDSVAGTSNKLLAAARQQKAGEPHVFPLLLATRTDLRGLPLRMGLDCQLGKESAEELQVLSRKLRIYLSKSIPHDGLDTRPDAVVLRAKLLDGADAARRDWLQPEAVPTLVQLLQAEGKPVRLLLVDLLADIKGRLASQALAQRALFDLSDEVREAAVAALRPRPREEYRGVLVDGFRYPWAPVADHAAEALASLPDHGVVPDLVRLLDEPDPSLPVLTDKLHGVSGLYGVRELVRINHLKNCLLCHAVALTPADPVRGLVPKPGQPVPPSFTPEYYDAPDGIFARADITYLKQDFSVPQPVAHPGAWPPSQRFDYVLRTRPATFDDLDALVKRSASYPQREAVLFALRELTGRNPGSDALAWRSVLALAAPPGRME